MLNRLRNKSLSLLMAVAMVFAFGATQLAAPVLTYADGGNIIAFGPTQNGDGDYMVGMDQTFQNNISVTVDGESFTYFSAFLNGEEPPKYMLSISPDHFAPGEHTVVLHAEGHTDDTFNITSSYDRIVKSYTANDGYGWALLPVPTGIKDMVSFTVDGNPINPYTNGSSMYNTSNPTFYYSFKLADWPTGEHTVVVSMNGMPNETYTFTGTKVSWAESSGTQTATNPTSGQVPVYITVESSYTVSLPAAINLTKAVDPDNGSNDKYYDNSAANDTVSVSGNIADDERIIVTPSNEIQLTMQRTTGPNLVTDVTVTQTIKEWANASVSGSRHAMSETEPLNLNTTLPDTQAGKYQGNLAFTFAKSPL